MRAVTVLDSARRYLTLATVSPILRLLDRHRYWIRICLASESIRSPRTAVGRRPACGWCACGRRRASLSIPISNRHARASARDLPGRSISSCSSLVAAKRRPDASSGAPPAHCSRVVATAAWASYGSATTHASAWACRRGRCSRRRGWQQGSTPCRSSDRRSTAASSPGRRRARYVRSPASTTKRCGWNAPVA